MGRSAKVHKRTQVKKTKSSAKPSVKPSAGPSGGSSGVGDSSQSQVRAAKKRVGLKEKSGAKRKTATTTVTQLQSGVLGGADYVSLMMGGRKKAREEAGKLPKD